MCTVKVLRQFGFDASLLRSAAVAVDAEALASTAMLFVRGAPSVIGQLVSQGTLPTDYQQVTIITLSISIVLILLLFIMLSLMIMIIIIIIIIFQVMMS